MLLDPGSLTPRICFSSRDISLCCTMEQRAGQCVARRLDHNAGCRKPQTHGLDEHKWIPPVTLALALPQDQIVPVVQYT